MIKLRTKDGKRLKVSQDIPFIEICDLDGNLGAVVHVFDSGEIKIYTPGDDSFSRYVSIFKSKTTHYAVKADQYMKQIEQHDKDKAEAVKLAKL